MIRTNQAAENLFNLICGGVLCRLLTGQILIYPRGSCEGHLSAYFKVADSETLPLGWSREVNFSLTILNQNSGAHSTKNGILICSFLSLHVFVYADWEILLSVDTSAVL